MSTLGIDVDGVLADFNRAYIALVVDTARDYMAAPDLPVTMVREVDGRQQTFYVPFSRALDSYPDVFPAIWDYPQKQAGYPIRVMDAVWRRIKKAPSFWSDISPLAGASEACAALEALSTQGHDVYFITARPGVGAKRQTEEWLQRHGMTFPTVILSADKGTALKLLRLDAYVDDRLLNVNDAMRVTRVERMLTRIYLITRPYNLGAPPMTFVDGVPQEPVAAWDTIIDPAVKRVDGVLAALTVEGL